MKKTIISDDAFKKIMKIIFFNTFIVFENVKQLFIESLFSLLTSKANTNFRE